MFNKDFYPTPINLLQRMTDGIEFRGIRTVLEPSAGKGDMAEYINNKFRNTRYRDNNTDKTMYDIDCIEIDPNLQHILKGLNHRIVHDDFLTFETMKKYDLIIANFPFSDGDKHLLKAIEIQKRSGGQIVCLINAETLKNPYSNTRKDLAQQLEDLNAEIEFIQDGFTDAERNTGVETAIIRLNIPVPKDNSVILDKLKRDEVKRQQHTVDNSSQLIDGDFVIAAVKQCKYEIETGVNLIREYEKIRPFMSKEFDKEDPILQIKINSYDMRNETEPIELINGYIKAIRYKYWKALFNSNEFGSLLTEEMKREYNEKLTDLQDYDFSIYNINQIRADMSKHLVSSLDNTILSLFEDFTHKYNYSEYSKNIHMYNGWKTNKAYKINKKVIIPLSGFDRWGEGKIEYRYGTKDRLQDIEKVFNYLDGGLTDHVDLIKTLEEAEENKQTKKIDLKYFEITFYLKGTCHILFKDDDLLQKFNLFGSQRKGWLPPHYGKTSYKSMSKEDQQVVDAFEGEESYTNTVANQDYFLFNASDVLQIENTVA